MVSVPSTRKKREKRPSRIILTHQMPDPIYFISREIVLHSIAVQTVQSRTQVIYIHMEQVVKELQVEVEVEP